MLHYARFVKMEEIIEKNDYNLNIPRYITARDTEIQQDIDAHLHGGLPKHDIDQMEVYWKACPSLRDALFMPLSGREGYFSLKPKKGNEYIMGGANNYIDDKIVGILSCKIVPKNSIIFAKIGAAIYLERKRVVHSDCCIDNNMMAIQIINLFDYAFIYSKLQQIKLGNYATTTALPSLSSSTLSEITLTLPSSIVEQRIIATILSDMDKEIGELEAKLVKYEQVKQGMMQQLLTGKIRLID